MRKTRKPILTAAPRQPHFSIDADARQKMRLRGKAGQFESGLARRLRDKSEVHPRGDVLQTDVDEGVAAHSMPVMARERAVVALRQIILGTRQTIVNPQYGAGAQQFRDGASPRRGTR